MSYPKILSCLLLTAVCSQSFAQKADAILGKWKAEEKILTIQIYKSGSEYRGKIVSFKDRHHPELDPAKKLDEHNPKPALRSRRLIGTDILWGLQYKAPDHIWEDGTIYNPQKGNSYSVSARIGKNGKLELRAYKGISLLGKTMTFVRD